MDTFLKNITAFFGRLSIGQRIAIGTVVVGTIAAMVGLTVWFQQANFTLLFGNLPETAASQVVEILQNEEIEYKLKDGGTAIFVPNELVYDLRLRFAREGIISDGVTGYEIFDQTTLGMTDFMQKLNLRRALEGELSRTISSIDQVEAARVHLVIPERSPFRESQNNATSSVVLELKPGARLSEANIQGITALVAGALMYYLQVYAYYNEVAAEQVGGVQLVGLSSGVAEPILFENYKGIDSDSSPIRYRSCFDVPQSLAMLTETYVMYPQAEPLLAHVAKAGSGRAKSAIQLRARASSSG